MCLYDVHTDKIIKLKTKIKELEAEIEVQKQRVVLSESQNYCKICGNILDGYMPPKEKKNENQMG